MSFHDRAGVVRQSDVPDPNFFMMPSII